MLPHGFHSGAQAEAPAGGLFAGVLGSTGTNVSGGGKAHGGYARTARGMQLGQRQCWEVCVCDRCWDSSRDPQGAALSWVGGV